MTIVPLTQIHKEWTRERLLARRRTLVMQNCSILSVQCRPLLSLPLLARIAHFPV